MKNRIKSGKAQKSAEFLKKHFQKFKSFPISKAFQIYKSFHLKTKADQFATDQLASGARFMRQNHRMTKSIKNRDRTRSHSVRAIISIIQ